MTDTLRHLGGQPRRSLRSAWCIWKGHDWHGCELSWDQRDGNGPWRKMKRSNASRVCNRCGQLESFEMSIEPAPLGTYVDSVMLVKVNPKPQLIANPNFEVGPSLPLYLRLWERLRKWWKQ